MPDASEERGETLKGSMITGLSHKDKGCELKYASL